MNAIQMNDTMRRAASQITERAARLAGLEPPIPGLGVAITHVQEEIFQILMGHKGAIENPSTMLLGAWVTHYGGFEGAERIMRMVADIAEKANDARLELAAEAGVA